MQDLYTVLGVERNASQQDIKKAYRRLAMEHHPDRNVSDPTAEEKFKSVSEAYSVLKDETLRREYDIEFIDRQQHRHSNFNSGVSGFQSSHASWEEMFGSASSKFNPNRAHIIKAHIDVTLEDIYRSIRKSFILDGQHIEFRLPETSRPGQVIPIKLSQSQQLHITINLIPHNTFSIKGDDLCCRIDVPIKLAITGGHMTVPTLDGSIGLKIPPSTSSHTKLRVRNTGLQLSSHERSSIIYEVRIDMKTLSEELRQSALTT